METEQTMRRFLNSRGDFIASLTEPTVLTWGFRPVHDVAHILFLKQQGFFLAWLDGNRWASFRAFVNRGTVSEAMYYLQMFNIEQTRIIQHVQPHAIINPFDGNGFFRPTKDIADELLGEISS